MDRRLFLGGLSSALGAFWFGAPGPKPAKPIRSSKTQPMPTPVASGIVASPGGAFTTTITASGSNRLLVVWVGLADGVNAPISATYNGSAIADRGYWHFAVGAHAGPLAPSFLETHVFWTVAPVGSAAFAFNVAAHGIVSWAAFDNADQASPVRWPYGEEGFNNPAAFMGWPRTSLVSASDVVYGLLLASKDDGGSIGITSPGAGVTQLDSPTTNTGLAPVTGLHGYASGDGTDGVVWGWSETADGVSFLDAAVVIRAAGLTPYAGTATPWAWGDADTLPTGDAYRHWADPIPSSVALKKASMQGLGGIGLGADGYPWVWGDPTYGQRANGTTGGAMMRSAVQVAGLTGTTDVAAGDSTMFAIVGGVLKGWGRNASGELGDGSTTQRTSPVTLTVTGATLPLVQVVCGSGWTLVRDSLGKVFHAGWAAQGQRGDGLNTTDFYTSWAQVGSLSGCLDISAGASHGLAVNADGTVSSWGADAVGQCGRGSTASIRAVGAMAVVTGATKVAGYTNTSAVLAGGSIYTCGFNGVGQRGDGTLTSTSTLATISTPVTPTALAVHSCNGRALLWIGTDGKLYACGLNATREIESAVQISPSPISLGSGNLLTSTAVLADRMGSGFTWAATADDGEGFIAGGARRARVWTAVIGL